MVEESYSNSPKLGTEAPVTSEEAVDIENGCMPASESPKIKSATDKIIANSVGIDVINPVQRTDSEISNTNEYSNIFLKDGCPEKKHENKGKNMFKRYFERKTAGLTQSQIAILCIFPFVEFFAATVISIQGPFYPDVAQQKGATLTESGIVFGAFELVVFITAPIYGAKMGQLNPRRLFNYGIFTTSATCMLFGFVNHINDRASFVIMSLIIRVIEAIGDAAFVTASFSIIAAEFPESVATTFATMETFYGFGLIAGPTVGGALFKLGGFTLPFLCMGGLLFACAIATFIYITNTSKAPTESVVSSSSFEMFKMLRVPTICLTAFGTFAAATGIGFLNNGLQPHLRQFNLDPFQVGCIFMLNGGVYALSAPLWGMLCDKAKQLKIFSVYGAALTILGFALIGPIPLTSLQPSLVVICIGLVIFGLGLGSTLVSAFLQFLHDALENGYKEDVRTHGLVSGLWTSMTALGFFVGPTVGGILDDQAGFRWASLFIIFEHFLVLILLIMFFRHMLNSVPPTELTKSNMDDVVITYAVKTDTPKPHPRRRKSSTAPLEQNEETSDAPTTQQPAVDKGLQDMPEVIPSAPAECTSIEESGKTNSSFVAD